MKRTRVLLVAAFAIGALAWPAASLAGVTTGTGGAPLKGNAQVGPNLALPTLVPGATLGVVTWADATAWHGAAVFKSAGVDYYATDSGTSSDVWATLNMPAGSTLAQVDVYGYSTAAGTLDWDVFDVDGVNSSEAILANGASASGTGIIQTTFSTFNPSGTIAAGHKFEVDLRNSNSTTGVGFSGAVFQYFPPTMTLVPMTPVRVFDSRFSRFGGAINVGASRLVNVKNSIDVTTGADATADAIPAGARAISFTVTVTGTVGSGYVAVLPGITTTVTASTINWSGSGQTLAAGGIVTLGSGAAERQVTLVVGGSAGSGAQVLLDITGYYM